MRRDGVLQFQEASEKAFFCAPEGSHLGAAGGATKHRDEGDDKKLPKLMARIAGARVGDVVEGGEEDLHEGTGLQNMNPQSRIDAGFMRKGTGSRPQFQMRFP